MAVLRHVAALLGEHGVSQSHVTYGLSAPSTTWLIFLVTEDARLIKLHVGFDAEQYDRDEELQPIRQRRPVASTVHAAWVRHLADVAQLDIGQVLGRPDAFEAQRGDQFNLGDAHLTFRDGFKVDLGINQATMPTTTAPSQTRSSTHCATRRNCETGANFIPDSTPPRRIGLR